MKIPIDVRLEEVAKLSLLTAPCKIGLYFWAIGEENGCLIFSSLSHLISVFWLELLHVFPGFPEATEWAFKVWLKEQFLCLQYSPTL